ncbi:MAG: hypothetical protein V4795_08085 [Pseudomonadota bacterium]
MALSSTRRLRLTVFGGMLALMLGGVLLAFWPFIAANRNLQAFCTGQPPGTALQQVQASALERGYVLATVAPGVVLVDDPLGFGRRQCRLALDAQGRVLPPDSR